MVREGQTFLMPKGMGSENKEVTITDVGEGEPAEGFGSKLAEGRVKLDRRPPVFDDDFLPGRVIETNTIREEINPQRIHQNRNQTEQIADEAKDAEITTDPLKWASAPDRYDYPGVDTGPQFEDTFGGGFDNFADEFDGF